MENPAAFSALCNAARTLGYAATWKNLCKRFGCKPQHSFRELEVIRHNARVALDAVSPCTAREVYSYSYDRGERNAIRDMA